MIVIADESPARLGDLRSDCPLLRRSGQSRITARPDKTLVSANEYGKTHTRACRSWSSSRRVEKADSQRRIVGFFDVVSRLGPLDDGKHRAVAVRDNGKGTHFDRCWRHENRSA
jgi:hypothetical protein